MNTPAGFRGAFREDLRARAAYSEGAGIYRILPVAVARPEDTGDLRLLVAWARAGQVPLVPRGAGSAVTGSSVGPGVIVDLTGMRDRKLEVDPGRRSATVSPGITAKELQDAALDHGMRLPPDPSSSRWATLGGMVSTNAAGARSLKYGSVRRWVRRVEMIDGDGVGCVMSRDGAVQHGPMVERLLELAPDWQAAVNLIHARFPRTRKNASGYALDAWLESGDLVELVVGAEGTLGFITEVEWELAPVPAHRAGVRLDLKSLDYLADATRALLGLGPSAIEVLDQSFLEVAGETGSVAAGTAAVLLVELESDDVRTLRGMLDDAVKLTRAWTGEVATALTRDAERSIWALRHAASPRIASLPEDRRSLQVIEDACVPLERMGDYIKGIRQIADVHEVPAVIFGHAGDGNIHVNLIPRVNQPGWAGGVERVFEEVSALVLELDGTTTGEHGDGRIRAGLLENQFGPEVITLFQQIKDACDPAGIMNPGVKLSEHPAPMSDLKTGSDAIPLPEDISRALRSIERGGGYAQNRLTLADGI